MVGAMNRLKQRLATFDKWPRSSPTVQALAEAGFYYSGDPADIEDDTVTCFCCDKELSGWEDGDDPLNEHLAHPKTKAGCSWALLMSEKRKPTIPPTHATLLKAREATFKGWPHEKERGWVGKSKKMAKAGFHFAPSLESADAVECIYCNLGLDGWEPKDDPLVEHERRAKDLQCAFFNGIQLTGGASSIFAMTKDVFAAQMSAKEPSPVPSEDDSTATRTSRQRGRQSSLAPTTLAAVPKEVEKKKSVKRKLPGARARKIMDLDDSIEIGESVQEPIPIVLKSARKKRGSADMLEQPDESPSQQEAYKRPRLRRARSNSVSSITNYAEDILSPVAEKASRRQSRARGQKGRAPLEDVSETIYNVDSAEVGAIQRIKEEEEEDEVYVVKPRTARGRRPSAQPEAEKENPIKPVKAKRTRVSTTGVRRSTRASSIEPMPVVTTQECSTDSEPLVDHLLLSSHLPVTIQEECEEESTMTDSFTSANSRPGLEVPSGTIQDSSGAASPRTEASQKQVNTTLVSSHDPSETSHVKVTSKTPARRGSTRRGSAATRSNLEDVIRLSSHPISELQSVTTDAIPPIDTQEQAKSNSSGLRQALGSQRRTSSRRRPSNSLQSDNIEDVVMLDHRAKPKAQRVARKAAVLSSAHNIGSSQEIVIEEEAEEEVSIPQIKSTGDTIRTPEIAKQVDEVCAMEIVLDDPPAHSKEAQTIMTVEPAKELAEQVDHLTAVVSPTQSDTAEDVVRNAVQEEAFTINDNDRPVWYKSFRELIDSARKAMGTELADLSSLSSDQLSMTVEGWLTYMARQEAMVLTSQCDEMIAKMVEAGHRARSEILEV
ncbi:putative Chromosome segregation protein BIR1 [Taphrina deformans PYCC 5710]|uniref:Chromosome segregation protein BIR1 n=1 Tax=Taphrina deformans (strain PYCC 5710 / ATCC 11124 / CBS 356.35 / IMI 108563 / JCM 9778 / NBRC 8474) TaxID=1097556 RepID=R4XBI6_TAPDE|nr:putative Chromosome segregation protein BIR1 [Taphrina deformans PYCC 5710]|eukprot:CCG81736.1 putative Chromosome segregation protein BIR1 [Taphrina deformans PYCC 5710]